VANRSIPSKAAKALLVAQAAAVPPAIEEPVRGRRTDRGRKSTSEADEGEELADDQPGQGKALRGDGGPRRENARRRRAADAPAKARDGEPRRSMSPDPKSLMYPTVVVTEGAISSTPPMVTKPRQPSEVRRG